MPVVNLDDKEWQQVMGLLSEGPWRVANPLLMKIGDQLRTQAQIPGQLVGGTGIGPVAPPKKGNKEIHHE